MFSLSVSLLTILLEECQFDFKSIQFGFEQCSNWPQNCMRSFLGGNCNYNTILIGVQLYIKVLILLKAPLDWPWMSIGLNRSLSLFVVRFSYSSGCRSVSHGLVECYVYVYVQFLSDPFSAQRLLESVCCSHHGKLRWTLWKLLSRQWATHLPCCSSGSPK